MADSCIRARATLRAAGGLADHRPAGIHLGSFPRHTHQPDPARNSTTRGSSWEDVGFEIPANYAITRAEIVGPDSVTKESFRLEVTVTSFGKLPADPATSRGLSQG